MKKSKIIRLFITCICILAISIGCDNVYGYQLKYRVIYNTSETDSRVKGYGIIRTIGNTFGDPPNTNKWNNTTKGVDDSFKSIEKKNRI